MKKTIKDAYGEILRLRNDFYQKWQETPQYDEENKYAYKAKYKAFDKALELLTPSIVDHQPEEPMTADKVNLDRCICDIDLVASGREDCERIRKHIRAIRRIFAGLPEELSHTEVTKTSDQKEPVSDDLDEEDSFDELLQKLYIKYNKGVSIEKLLDIASNFVKWQKEKDRKGFELLKEWFEEIAERCSRLTSGNVSHNGKAIRGFARNCAEYIKTDLL